QCRADVLLTPGFVGPAAPALSPRRRGPGRDNLVSPALLIFLWLLCGSLVSRQPYSSLPRDSGWGVGMSDRRQHSSQSLAHRAERGQSCPQQLPNFSLVWTYCRFPRNKIAADRNVRAPLAKKALPRGLSPSSKA